MLRNQLGWSTSSRVSTTTRHRPWIPRRPAPTTTGRTALRLTIPPITGARADQVIQRARTVMAGQSAAVTRTTHTRRKALCARAMRHIPRPILFHPSLATSTWLAKAATLGASAFRKECRARAWATEDGTTTVDHRRQHHRMTHSCRKALVCRRDNPPVPHGQTSSLRCRPAISPCRRCKRCLAHRTATGRTGPHCTLTPSGALSPLLRLSRLCVVGSPPSRPCHHSDQWRANPPATLVRAVDGPSRPTGTARPPSARTGTAPFPACRPSRPCRST